MTAGTQVVCVLVIDTGYACKVYARTPLYLCAGVGLHPAFYSVAAWSVLVAVVVMLQVPVARVASMRTCSHAAVPRRRRRQCGQASLRGASCWRLR